MNEQFKVIILGQTNVGKSSLFNALLGYRRVIVYDQAGTTVDTITENVDWGAGNFCFADTQGVLESEEPEWVDSLLAEANLVLYVVDGKRMPTTIEVWLANYLRQKKIRTFLVVNKLEGKKREEYLDYASLGFSEILPISVAERWNMESVKEACLEVQKEWNAQHSVAAEGESKEPELKLALVGRPNTGKSTLMNRLCRRAVSSVSSIAHTTRDPVSFEIETSLGKVRLTDTAGIRKKHSQGDEVETFSIQAAKRSIRKSDVVFVLMDCSVPITEQDVRLLSLVLSEGRPTALLFNKWDKTNATQRRELNDYLDRRFGSALKNTKKVEISGLRGKNVERLLPLASSLRRASERRTPTGRLNRFVQQLIERNPPPAVGDKNFNILYASQVRSKPPTFVFFLNRRGALPNSYQKYLVNQLRKEYGLKGQAIRLRFRQND